MPDIRVAVNGALGRMGQTVLGAVGAADGLTPVGGADAAAATGAVAVPGNPVSVPLRSRLDMLIEETSPAVVVEFTNGDGALSAVRTAVPRGVRIVSGSTGLSETALEEVRRISAEHGIGVISASNFALGAVLLGHLASIASRYFSHADLVESHHEAKADSPSGTALSLAEAMLAGRNGPFDSTASEKETLAGARGGVTGGINVHSARMPGRLARHEIVLGTQGQTLTLIHDTIDRDCYMPGVLRAIEHVVTIDHLVIGLDRVLGLGAPGKA